MTDDEMRIREAIERDFGKLSGPMSWEEFIEVLDALDAEKDEED